MSNPNACARAGQDRANLYDEITDKIIAELEAGRVPWVQPWGTAAAKAPLAMPKNASTNRQYSGVNVLILWGAVIERGFPGQSWLTFPPGTLSWRPRPQGRARHYRRLRRSFHPE
jgi:antirestriction protein ArdC